MLLGYARVSTVDQNLALQRDMPQSDRRRAAVALLRSCRSRPPAS